MHKYDKIKKLIILFLKIIVVLASYFFIIKKIYLSPDLKNFSLYFLNLNYLNHITLSLIIILMFSNWSFEAIKWKLLIKPLEIINFANAFKAVWTGVTIGTITPNRIGEFGGRILFVEKEKRIKATSLTLYGDLSQFITTLIFGIIGFYLISSNILFEKSEIKQFEQIILISGLVVIAICIFFYFNINLCINLLKKIKKISLKFIPNSKIDFRLKAKTLLFSLIRYIIFSIQFYFSLRFFNIEISFYNSIIATSSMYLCLNIIPNIPFAEIAFRSSFAIIFIGIFTNKITAIVLASLLIYIINIAIPGIIGGLFLFKIRNKNIY